MTRAAVKTVNLALQGGGSHGAYTWGALDALIADERIEIEAISGTSAGAVNAVVFAAGFAEGGRTGAREKLEALWRSVSTEGPAAPAQLKLVEAWIDPLRYAWPAERLVSGLADAWSRTVSPYELNPLNLNPLRGVLSGLVDFEKLRSGDAPKLFVAATNIRTGRGEVFRREVLTVDHVAASACVPQVFQAVQIGDQAYWDGGFTGNPPLWPLFYETQCRDVIIVQINPIEREDVPKTPEGIADRVNEITLNASLIGELEVADFAARLVRSGLLKSDTYQLPRFHRIGGAGKLERYNSMTKFDVSWGFLQELRDLGRADAKAWLAVNFGAIGVESTLDIDRALTGPLPNEPIAGPRARR
ncbi:MAG TPA: patatin-like phospholipase family protein [Roseiarcus sp.]|nr:patatin-like phospholipase family protein [Roseiarcus sp.]